MAPAKIQRAIGVMKDRTSVGLAMVGGSNNSSDIEIAIIKATCHNHSPPQDRYVRRIINLTAFSKPLVSACISKIGKRLNKTKNWVVALKTLMLVHRLLNTGDHTFQEEMFITRRGARFLNMSGFRDASSKSNSWDFSAFVRTYAHYLDEQLEFRMEEGTRSKTGRYVHRAEDDNFDGAHGGGTSKEVLARPTQVHEMKNDNVFARVQRLKQLLNSFLACRPTGAAKCNKVVDAALDQVVKESFDIFYNMMAVIATLVERFMQFEVHDMVRVHEIFCHVSKQYDDLDAFYDWCKNVGIMSSSEFPIVEKIPKAKLDVMDSYIHKKSELLRNRNGPRAEMISIPEAEESEEKECIIEALPPVEVFETGIKNKGANTGDIKQVENEKKKTQDIGELFKVDDDSPSTPQKGHTVALMLFDSAPLATTASENTIAPWVDFKDDSSGVTQWEPFKDSPDDWEAKLVQSAGNSMNQRTPFTRSFDPVMLDGMYQDGSLSYSGPVAYGSPGRLALPVPSAGNGRANLLPSNADPFAGSLVNAPSACNGGDNCLPSNANPFTASPVIASSADHGRANSFSSKPYPFATTPPPDYVRASSFPANTDPFITSTVIGPPLYMQMSEIEKQQRLLAENQLYWYQQQQYPKDGITRLIGIGNVHQQYPYQYFTEGYTQAW